MRIHNLNITGSVEVKKVFQPPFGTSDKRPSSPSTGSLFYNTTDNILEVYTGEWTPVTSQGA